MKTLFIRTENIPGDVRSGAKPSRNIEAIILRNGDVEITASHRSGDSIIAVIPKEKRAELANFLVNAQ